MNSAIDESGNESPDSEEERPTTFSDKFRRTNQPSLRIFQQYSPTQSQEHTAFNDEILPVSEVVAVSQDPQDLEQTQSKTFFESLQSISSHRNTDQVTTEDETAINYQENSMPKTDGMSMVAAIELIRHSVDRELETIADAGARAFQDLDMDAVERFMKRTRRVKEFRDQLTPALAAWEKLGREE